MDNKITIRSLILGLFFAVLFAVLTSYFENRKAIYISATQIAVLPYALLILTVLLVNPICRLLRFIRPYSPAEILIVFIMGSVSSGISTFGLVSQVGPVFSSLFNEHWNNDQTEWNLYVEPYVNEAFFISEPGVQKAAKEYRDALVTLRETRKIYDVAFKNINTAAAMQQAEERRDGLDDFSGDAADKAMLVNRADQDLKSAQNAKQEAVAEWRETNPDGSLPSPTEVVDSYTGIINNQERTMKVKKAALRKLEVKAFAKVDLFRRGLGKDKSAFPGFFPLPGDNAASYQRRFRRMKIGIDALKDLNRATGKLQETDAASASASIFEGVITDLDSALAKMEGINDKEQLVAEKNAADDDWDRYNQDLEKMKTDIKELRHRRRDAPQLDFERLDREIDDLQSRIDRHEERKKDANKFSERVQRQLFIADRLIAAIGTLKGIRDAVSGAAAPAPDTVARRIQAVMALFPSFDASMRRYLVGDVPWRTVLKPLGLWAVLIGLTYIILMSFNVLIFRQWAYNEKLIFPLAELPELLTVSDAHTSGRIPALFRSPLFWLGVMISGSVLGWNLFSYAQIIPGLPRIDLDNNWSNIIENTQVAGLRPSAKSTVFFTMIGVSFMIPAKISFSLWFFWLLFMLQTLILVWSGHGIDQNSFPVDWWYTLNYRTAEGGGALMVFAVVILFKCRRYIFCFFAPASVGELETGERRELITASFLFIFGSIALVLSLWLLLGANLYYTIFCYFIVMVITVGLVRAVAEGGILGFQAWISPFHFIRSLVGMDKTWTTPSLFAPLFIYYSILFLDIKTFIAPAMANSLKIRDDLKMMRGRFHIAIIFGIVGAVLAAVITHLIMTYSSGGDAMNDWFYTSFPDSVYKQIAAMTKTMPVDTSGGQFWIGFGAAVMAGLLYLRQFVFWLPHPIGMIMLVNPIMNAYWFSIMIGWFAKMLVTRYGNKDTYRIVRCLFVGLIAGELLIVILALLVSLTTDLHIPIDLNRN